jgi:hypothetical protein
VSESPSGDAGEHVLHDPAPERSGSDVQEAVDTAEEGSQVEGQHSSPSGVEPGESRVEQMADVPGLTEPDELNPDTQPNPGRTPAPKPGP